MFWKKIKIQLIIFLTCFAIFLSVKDKDIVFLASAFIATISAIAVDSCFIYLKEKRFRLNDSSLISGLIIGFVLYGGQPLWVFLLVSLFGIGSKHLIKIKGRHLFNPAAFGIFIATIFFAAPTQWKGTFLWYILVPFGIYFTYKISKLEVAIGYFLTTLLLFGTQAAVQKVPFLNIFGYLSYFYIFVMVIEPKTTPIKPLGKLIFGIGIAVLIFVLTEIGVKFDAELCALLVFNLAVPLLNKLPDFRK